MHASTNTCTTRYSDSNSVFDVENSNTKHSPSMNPMNPNTLPALQNTTAVTNELPLLEGILKVLDEGPGELGAFGDNTTVVLAVATPLSVLCLCILLLCCRCASKRCQGCHTCFGWNKMKYPSGLEPDAAIGEHQDELCEVDSVDEDTDYRNEPMPECEEDDGSMREIDLSESHKKGCSRMAAALEKTAETAETAETDGSENAPEGDVEEGTNGANGANGDVGAFGTNGAMGAICALRRNGKRYQKREKRVRIRENV